MKLADRDCAMAALDHAMAPARYAAVIGNRVIPEADLVDIAPGREARSRRHTDRTVGVSRREPGSARGKPIDVWRAHQRMARAPHQSGIMLIGQNDYQVSRLHNDALGFYGFAMP